MFLKSNENNKFGSGLGLSIVKDMVKILGKDFKVESKYNEGTSISFLLNKNIDSEIDQMNIQNLDNNKNIKNNQINRKEKDKDKDNLNSSTSALTGNTSTNLDPINYKNKNKRASLFTHKEENTKREEYILMKPQDIATIPNGIKKHN